MMAPINVPLLLLNRKTMQIRKHLLKGMRLWCMTIVFENAIYVCGRNVKIRNASSDTDTNEACHSRSELGVELNCYWSDSVLIDWFDAS